jgi:hypothetical protein
VNYNKTPLVGVRDAIDNSLLVGQEFSLELPDLLELIKEGWETDHH